MSNGIGFNLRLLFGADEQTPTAVLDSAGKTIRAITLAEDEHGNDFTTGMAFLFTDDTAVIFYDDARSCCEHRYMTTDDDLAPFVGATFMDVALSEKNTPAVEESQSEWDDGEQHEWCFVDFTTSMGVFTSTMHDRHNGYYGGIALAARTITADEFKALTPAVKN